MGVAAGGLALAGGAAAPIRLRRAAAYDDAVEATWQPVVKSAARQAALRELVRAATLAANSHNTRPWLFRVNDDAIELTPDLARRCPAVDPDDHHIFASLGCAAENVVQAAPVFGLRATTTTLPWTGCRSHRSRLRAGVSRSFGGGNRAPTVHSHRL